MHFHNSMNLPDTIWTKSSFVTIYPSDPQNKSNNVPTNVPYDKTHSINTDICSNIRFQVDIVSLYEIIEHVIWSNRDWSDKALCTCDHWMETNTSGCLILSVTHGEPWETNPSQMEVCTGYQRDKQWPYDKSNLTATSINNVSANPL